MTPCSKSKSQAKYLNWSSSSLGVGARTKQQEVQGELQVELKQEV